MVEHIWKKVPAPSGGNEGNREANLAKQRRIQMV